MFIKKRDTGELDIKTDYNTRITENNIINTTRLVKN